MRVRGAGLLCLGAAALALAGPAGAAPGDGGPPDGLGLPAGPARSAEFQRKVDDAIGRGVLWLRGGQAADGSFSCAPCAYSFAMGTDLGLQAISIYTLRACGVPADDAVIVSGLKTLRTVYRADRRQRALQTYTVSLTLLALEAHYAPAAAAAGSGDRYGKGAAGTRNIPSEDLDWIRELAAWLVQAQMPGGSFGYSSPAAGWSDNSNAQFALLGLKAARRCGVDVPRSVFRAALRHFVAAQQALGTEVVRKEPQDGGGARYGTGSRATTKDHARGWSYRTERHGASGTMTSSGVSSLVICRGELLGSPGYGDDEDARVVRAIRDGIAWLGANFSVRGAVLPGAATPIPMAWHYYYLYGLERAGVLAGVAWMGEHDWYLEGAEYLLKSQSARGGWQAGMPGMGAAAAAAGGGDLLDSCFALLFLKKATFRVEGAVATEQRDDLDLTGAADLDDASFAAVFDTVFARYLKAGPDRRGTLAPDFVAMGPRAVPLLVRRLEDEADAARATAIEVLEKVTGQTLGYRPADPPEARSAAVAAWEAWWFARRATLVPDPAAGRFREGGGVK